MVSMLQVTEAGEAELPLAAPTVANWLQVRLPPGNVSVVVYVRYADSASTSPLGLPAGARLQAPVLQMMPLLLFPAIAAGPASQPSSGRRLLHTQLVDDARAPPAGGTWLGCICSYAHAAGDCMQNMLFVSVNPLCQVLCPAAHVVLLYPLTAFALLPFPYCPSSVQPARACL